MMIIGVDYHPSFQQIAFLIEETVSLPSRQAIGPLPALGSRRSEGGRRSRDWRPCASPSRRVRGTATLLMAFPALAPPLLEVPLMLLSCHTRLVWSFES